MSESITIDQRFNGPPGSANGGYACGRIARYIPGDAAVRLRIPPPLNAPMQVHTNNGQIQVFHKDKLVATGRPTTLDIDLPDYPGFAQAQAASRRYKGFDEHNYPTCFVCGPGRKHDDGLQIYAGAVEQNGSPGNEVAATVAATWIPAAEFTGADGAVKPEFIWAALDCPGAYAFWDPIGGAILLGELAVSIRGSVLADEKCVVMGWETGQDGRKHFTGTALFGASGKCIAVGQATWFEIL